MTNVVRLGLRSLKPRNNLLSALPEMESVYRDLFVRELARLGEQDIYFPVGGAANHGLLFIILMTAIRCRPASVLDIGCGQTTLLWSRLMRRGLVRSVTTLESDEVWAAEIGRSVDHPIVVTPLRPVAVGAHTLNTYDWTSVGRTGPFDVMVVDGPRGEHRHSRGGILQMIDDSLPADFLIVLDDAERLGEQDTVALIHDRLNALGRAYTAGVMRAATTQCIFAGGDYARIAYL